MPKHFWFLFAAYSIIWLGLFGYVLKLLGRTGEMRRELDRLRDSLGGR